MIEALTQAVWMWLTTHGMRSVILLAGAWLAYRLLQIAMTRFHRVLITPGGSAMHERRARALTLANVLRSFGVFVIVSLAALMVLSEVGIDITPLIAGASVVGLAIGLGAQTLVRDVLGGLFVLIEDQFHVGDVVQVGGVAGTVEQITLRATYLRDGDGTLHLVPNGEMRVVSNRTTGWSRAIVDVRVGHDQDMHKVMQALNAAVGDVNDDPAIKPQLLEPLSVTGIEALNGDTMIVRMIGKVKAGQQDAVSRAVRQRVKERCATEGVALPMPHALLVREAK
ncbi:MAG: mechanosensitive ion channel family protein [Chloroflexota bacterium]